VITPARIADHFVDINKMVSIKGEPIRANPRNGWWHHPNNSNKGWICSVNEGLVWFSSSLIGIQPKPPYAQALQQPLV
jgi:hypothetical protein